MSHNNLLTINQQGGAPTGPPGSEAGHLLLRIGAWVMMLALALLLWRTATIFLLTFVGLLLAVFVRALTSVVSRFTPLTGGRALVVALAGLVMFFGVAGWLIAPDLFRQMALLAQTLSDALGTLQERLAQTTFGRQVLEQMPPLTATDVLTRVAGVFSATFNMLAYAVFIFFVTLFLAVNPELYRAGIVRLAPPRHRDRAREVVDVIVVTLRAWLIGRAIAMLIVGLVVGVGLWLLGVPLALSLGFLAGFLEFIPYVGPVLAAAPALLLAFAREPELALYVLLLYVGVQQFEGDLLTPIIQEVAVDLPPVVTLVATFVMGALFGMLGLLVATPLAAVVMVLVRMLYLEDVLGDTVDLPGRHRRPRDPAADERWTYPVNKT